MEVAFAISTRGDNLKVKCKICGELNEKDDAYKVVVGRVNTYYCSEEEYLESQKEKQLKKEIKNNVYKIIEDIIGKTINTVLHKEVNIWLTVSDYNTIFEYLKENKTFIEKQMGYKNFDNSTEYTKIRYFSAIVKNNLSDFKPKKAEVIKNVETEIYENNFKQKVKRKCLSDYEDGDEI